MKINEHHVDGLVLNKATSYSRTISLNKPDEWENLKNGKYVAICVVYQSPIRGRGGKSYGVFRNRIEGENLKNLVNCVKHETDKYVVLQYR